MAFTSLLQEKLNSYGKTETRVKGLPSIHHKWHHPGDSQTDEEMGRSKYKTVSDIPDLYGVKHVLPGNDLDDVRRFATRVASEVQDKSLAELVPHVFEPTPEDTADTLEQKERVGFLRVASVFHKDKLHLPSDHYRAYHLVFSLAPSNRLFPFAGLKHIELQCVNVHLDRENNSGKASRDVYKGRQIGKVRSFLEDTRRTEGFNVFVQYPDGGYHPVRLDKGAIGFDLLTTMEQAGAVTEQHLLQNRYRIRSHEGANAYELGLFDKIPEGVPNHHLSVQMIPHGTRNLISPGTFVDLMKKASHIHSQELASRLRSQIQSQFLL
ncbi:hypothetical protein HY994_06620 [Candidatus Micrarchaeota archaeon]|nr:hypothetical protein [Candidatus Micrarchaeota archaeon]